MKSSNPNGNVPCESSSDFVSTRDKEVYVLKSCRRFPVKYYPLIPSLGVLYTQKFNSVWMFVISNHLFSSASMLFSWRFRYNYGIFAKAGVSWYFFSFRKCGRGVYCPIKNSVTLLTSRSAAKLQYRLNNIIKVAFS